MAEHKLPVGDTVGASYRFVFGNLVQIFKLCALPIGLLSVVSYLINRWALDEEIANFKPADYDPKAELAAGVTFEPGSVLLTLGASCIEAALVAFAAAALHRMVLFGQHQPRLSAGPVDLRFVGLSVAAVVAYGVLNVVYLATVVGTAQGKAVAAAAFPIMIAYFIILILSLRLVQMFPVVIAEGRISFTRSWELTRGNWGRIFLANLLAFLPLFFVVLALIFIVVGVNALSPTQKDGAAMLKMLEVSRDTLLPMTVLNFVVYVLSTALGVALLSFSYKKLNGQNFDDVLTEQP